MHYLDICNFILIVFHHLKNYYGVLGQDKPFYFNQSNFGTGFHDFEFLTWLISNFIVNFFLPNYL